LLALIFFLPTPIMARFNPTKPPQFGMSCGNVDEIEPTTIYFLGMSKTVEANYSRLGALVDKRAFITAIPLIDSMRSAYKLSSERAAEMLSLMNLCQLLGSAAAANREIANLTPSEITTLEGIANNSSAGIAAKKAQNALCFHYGICFDQAGNPKSNHAQKKPRPIYSELVADLNKVDVYPNPADQYVTLAYNLLEAHENSRINVFDNLGRSVWSNNIGKNYRGQELIDTRKFANGIYVFRLIQDSKVVDSGKIVVTH